MSLQVRDVTERRLLWLAGISVLVAALVLWADPWFVGHHMTGRGWTVQMLVPALTEPQRGDSTGYMRLGEAAFQAPDHLIYARLFLVQHEKFIYPPSSLLLTEALSYAPRVHLTADGAFKALLLFCWAGTVLLGAMVYRRQRGRVSVLEAWCVLLLGVLFMPLTVALVNGQVQTLLMFLWGAAVWLWIARRHGWAGAALALCCVFKPQMAVFLVWGVWRRQWRFSAAFLGVLAVVEAVSVAHFGLRNHLDYLRVLSYLSRHGEAGVQNQSMAGLMNRLLHNGDPLVWQDNAYPPYRESIYVVSTVFGLLALLAALLLPRRGRGTTADLLLFGCTATIVSPIVWRHHYSIFFFAVVYLAARAGAMTRLRWALLVCAALAMGNYLAPLDSFYVGWLSLLDSYVFCAGLAVMVLLALDMRAEGEGYLRFQRTPSLESSRTMPFSSSSLRSASARAKLRCFLARVRSATKASMSASQRLAAPNLAMTSGDASSRRPSASAQASAARVWSASRSSRTAKMLSNLVSRASVASASARVSFD